MTELTGDILNWLAAGVLFPLMALPLAALATQSKVKSTGAWAAMVTLLTIAGVSFVWLTPVLGASLPAMAFIIFAGFVATAAIGIFLSGGAQAITQKLASLFERITTKTGRAVMWLLLLMALVQFAVVLLRYVFGINWIFMQESITYMHGFVFLLAGGYALLTDDHVRVDIFYREAPPKRKALTDLVGTYLFLFPICLIILWAASPYVARSWLVMEGSADTSGIQGVFILKTLIPAFAVLLSMAGFVIATRAVDVLKGRGE